MDFWSRHEDEAEFEDSKTRQVERAVHDNKLPGALRSKLEPLGIKFLGEEAYLMKVILPNGWVMSNEHRQVCIRDEEGKEKACLYVRPVNGCDTEWVIS